MDKWKVYKHTSPSGKIYIGITHQKPEHRWRNGKGYENNSHFWNAIQKYGWDNFTHEIIADGLTQIEAEEMEKRLVKELKSTDKKVGYNVALGGHVQSEESRRKIGETRRMRGIPSPTKGQKISAETKAKISKARIGMKRNYPLTEIESEHRRQSKLGIKNPNYGKPLNPELKQMLINNNSKAVIQIAEGQEIRHKSATEAGRLLGIFPGNITRVCKGQRETAGGFRWRYAEY